MLPSKHGRVRHVLRIEFVEANEYLLYQEIEAASQPASRLRN